jgi:hypothetical protein
MFLRGGHDIPPSMLLSVARARFRFTIPAPHTPGSLVFAAVRALSAVLRVRYLVTERRLYATQGPVLHALMNVYQNEHDSECSSMEALRAEFHDHPRRMIDFLLPSGRRLRMRSSTYRSSAKRCAPCNAAQKERHQKRNQTTPWIRFYRRILHR